MEIGLHFGENLVHDILVLMGKNPRKPKIMNGYNPDWETDDFIWEVKTVTGPLQVQKKY